MEDQQKPEIQTAEVKESPTSQETVNTSKKKINVPLVILGASLCIILVLGALVYVLIFKGGGNTGGTEASYVASGANRSGDLTTTQKSLEEALKESPDDPELLAAMITTIANEGNLTGTEEVAFQKGKPYMDRGLKSSPDNSSLLIAAGLLHEISGRYQEALEYYNKALATDPDNANGLFHKGHVLEFLGQVQESNEAYLRAYELDKENPSVLMALGKMALAQGKTDDSVAFYKAAAGTPNVAAYLKAEALTNASIIRRNQMLYMEEAIDLAQQAVNAYPSSSPALGALGFAYGINGRMDEGLESLKKAIASNPRISQNYWHMGQLLRSVSRYDEALSYQKDGYERVETDNTLLGQELRAKLKAAMAYDLAKTTYLSGQTEGVVELLTTALTFDPTLKTQLQTDVNEYDQFEAIANSQGMQNLVK